MNVLADFNAAPAPALATRLRACCAADAWIDAVTGGRPYPDESALGKASDQATASLGDRGLAQALAGHPRIGDRLAAPGADGEADLEAGRDPSWSRQEQSGMNAAGDGIRAAIAAANAEYERRFGHVYLVCATGRSAGELLAICRSRLANPPEAEREVVLAELAKINRLRLARLLSAGLPDTDALDPDPDDPYTDDPGTDDTETAR
jgi:2-oxo-4-hydroxy-4-carboxy-5-ureidoimidazoline decarboxylase